jgi:hypothetical protein
MKWRNCKLILYKTSIKEVYLKNEKKLNDVKNKEKKTFEKKKKVMKKFQEFQEEEIKNLLEKNTIENEIKSEIETKKMEFLKEKNIDFSEFLKFQTKFLENKDNFLINVEFELRENEHYDFFISLI